MATVYIDQRKRMNRNSYVIYYKHPISGKNKYYKTLPKKKEAQNEANRLRTLLDTGRLPEEQNLMKKPSFLTVSDIGEMLLNDWKLKLLNNDLSNNTVSDYSLRLRQILTEFDGLLVCEIRKKSVINYRNQLADTISNVTANRNLFVLKQITKFAVNQGFIFDDPARDVQYLSEKAHERNKYLLPQRLDSLVTASQQTRAKFYMPALIYLGAEHGAARQEALSLEWPHLDFEYKGIGFIRLFRTKNGKERTDYLMPRTKQALLDWKAHLEFMRHRKKIHPVESRFVFCRLNGEPIKRFDSAWRQICKIAGLTNFHYHDLRHTYCSNLLLSGANIKDVKEMIGHSDISMTDRYAHLSLDHHRAIQERLAKHYENLEN